MRSKFKFVIGDIQGCYKEFKALLKLIDPKKENKVFCVGDLVNRGPDSEKVVDFILENNIKSVLGNHDLHMLAILIGAKKHNKKKDTLQKVISKNKSLIFTVKDESLEIEKSILLGGKKILDNTCITISGNLVNKNKTFNWEIKKNI